MDTQYKILTIAATLSACCMTQGSFAADTSVAQRAHTVLKKHCYSCHGEQGTIEGGMNYVLSGRLLTSRGKVVPKVPGKSVLLRRIRDGEMPPAEVKTKMTDDEIGAISAWIKAGAPPFKTAVARKFISEHEIYKHMRADLSTVSSRSKRFIRYFTITHLYNSGLTEDELQTYRNALSKLINGLSWSARITVPKPVDPAKTVFRVDLRDFNWTLETWQKLLDVYPYGFQLADKDAEWCYKQSTSGMPRIRADWFVAKASQPPLYHEILGLPETTVALEKQLRIGVRDNIEQEKVIRAAFNSSGVSQGNRMIERHDSPYGAYWKSYDFGESRGRRNIFAYPLGPYELEKSFKHDGGEIIFSLPNGLHAYFLADQAGNRIDKGPTEIVSDPKRPDRKVVNGLSCMSCHSRGLIDKQDQVREHVNKNPKGFTKEDREFILALYKPREDFQKAFKRDVDSFRKAVEETGGRLGSTEPIVALTRRFEEEIDLKSAACEAGVPSAALVKGIQTSGLLARKLGVLNVQGGTVQREVLAEAFRDVVRQLKLGKPLDHLQAIRQMQRHVGGINHMAFTPDGTQLLSAGGDRTIRIWNVKTGEQVRELMRHPDPIRRFAVSSNGKQIATACKDGLVRLFDLKSGKLLKTFKGHRDMVFDVKFTADGKRLFSASMDRSVRVWDIKTGKELRAMWGHRSWVRSVDVAADGSIAASSGNGLILIVWDLKSWRPQQHFIAHKSTVHWVKFIGKTDRIVTCGGDYVIRYWNLRLRTQRLVKAMVGHTKSVRHVEVMPDGKFIISSAEDDTARMWHLDSGKEVHRFSDESSHAAIALSPDGKYLASANKDGTIFIMGVPNIEVEDDGKVRRTKAPQKR